MIVQYIGGEDFPDNDFIIGKEYVVIKISYRKYENSYRFGAISDQNNIDYPELKSKKISHFKIINSIIPLNWNFYLDDNHICLCPKEFLDSSIVKFEDNDPEAIKTFRRVVNETYAFHGLDPLYKDPPVEIAEFKDHEWWKEYVTDEPGKEDLSKYSLTFVQNNLGVDTINRILRQNSTLKTLYYDRLDHHSQCQIEKATLDQKWQSLGQSLLHHMQGSVIDPNVIIETLQQTETYLVQQENKARHAEVKEFFFRPLIDWIKGLSFDDVGYSSARLILRSLGPFCEEYVIEIDPEIYGKILHR